MAGDTSQKPALSLLNQIEAADDSISHLQAVLLVDGGERVLYGAQVPGPEPLPIDRFVGQDWRLLFDECEEVELDSEWSSDTSVFVRSDEPSAAYRVRRLAARSAPSGERGAFILVETVADPAAMDEMIYRERMMALGQIAAGVAHEVNNPLTTVSGWLQLLLAETDPDEKRRGALELMSEEINRISGIIRHLLSFGRRRPPEPQIVPVNRLLNEVLTLLRYQFGNDNIELITDLAADLPTVRGTPDQLKQVFLNIIMNARQAMPQGGTLTVTTQENEDGAIEVVMADTGCGMTDAVREKLFQPYYSTKKKRGGSGMGMFLSRNIVKEHGGRLLVSSQPNEGTVVVVILPPFTDKKGQKADDRAGSVPESMSRPPKSPS